MATTDQKGLSPEVESLMRDAARLGAEEAIRANRLRLRAWSGAIGFMCAIAVCIPLTIVLTNQARGQASDSALTLCKYQANGRVAGNQARFALRELLAFDADFLYAVEHPTTPQSASQKRATKIFLAKEQARLTRDLKAERRVTPGLPARLDSYAKLLPLLRDETRIVCHRA